MASTFDFRKATSSSLSSSATRVQDRTYMSIQAQRQEAHIHRDNSFLSYIKQLLAFPPFLHHCQQTDICSFFLSASSSLRGLYRQRRTAISSRAFQDSHGRLAAMAGFSACMWSAAFLFSSLILSQFSMGEAADKLSQLERSAESIVVLKNGIDQLTDNSTEFKAGEDSVAVQWRPQDLSESTYKKVKLTLCFTPVSQVDRPWRKTNDLLSKDKTCAFDLGKTDFSSNYTTAAFKISKSVPFAHYFVRGYVLDSNGDKVAYGNSSVSFTVQPITGRSASMDIAASVFSAFAVVSLFAIYFVERKLLVKKA